MTHLVPGNSLPFRSAATLYQRRHPISKQIRAFRYVNYVEDHSLVSLHVVHGEIEPHTKSRVASVRPDEQIVLEFRDKIHPAQVASFERGVEADVSFLRLPAMAWRSYYHLVHVAQSSFCIAVFALCTMIHSLWISRLRKIFEKQADNKRITSGYDIKRNESIHIKYKWKRKGKKQSDQLFDKG